MEQYKQEGMKRLDHVLSRLAATGTMLPTDAEELSVLRMRINIKNEKEYLACMEKDLSFKQDVQDKLLLALHKERQENLELHRKVEILRAFYSEFKQEQTQRQEQSIVSAAAAPEEQDEEEGNTAFCNTTLASEYEYSSLNDMQAPSPIATTRRHSVSF